VGWDELGLITNTREIIQSHSRLLRSLYFGDDDYGSCVSAVLEQILEQNERNADLMIDYIGLHDWLSKMFPQQHDELFGHTNPLLEHTEICAITNSFELNQHLARIRSSVRTDPELAIGSMKDLLETVMKTVLHHYGDSTEGEDFNVLLKGVQKRLRLDPSEVQPNAKGADLTKRTLSNLGQIVLGLNELRGIYGTGHGKLKKSGISDRHARLVVGAGATLATFLMETFQMQKLTEDNS
jgi:hypothetical protein